MRIKADIIEHPGTDAYTDKVFYVTISRTALVELSQNVAADETLEIPAIDKEANAYDS